MLLISLSHATLKNNEYKTLRVIGLLIIVLTYKHFPQADKDMSLASTFSLLI